MTSHIMPIPGPLSLPLVSIPKSQRSQNLKRVGELLVLCDLA